MIGSFLTRGLVMIFGYAYPAYECYKTVEMNKPEIEQLRFWCQYWILVAVLTVCERIGDAFISWVPMYSEAKLAFFIYLWYPKTKGTTYVYDSFFRPYVAKHETDIDRNLLELRTRAGDMAIIYWQRAASYAQTRIFEILQYVADQSTARPRRSQQQQGSKVPPDNVAPKHPATTANQVQIEPTSSTSQQQKDVAEEVGVSQVSKLKTTFEVLNTQKVPKSTTTVEVPSTSRGLKPSTSVEAPPSTPKVLKPSTSIEVPNTQKAVAASEPALASSNLSLPSEMEPMEIETVSHPVHENEIPSLKETVMEDSTKVTRARLRKTRSGLRPKRFLHKR
ncbi:HVA22-like protein i, partial [Cucurbita argyrosperma subsp. sororia]